MDDSPFRELDYATIFGPCTPIAASPKFVRSLQDTNYPWYITRWWFGHAPHSEITIRCRCSKKVSLLLGREACHVKVAIGDGAREVVRVCKMVNVGVSP